MSPDPPDSVEWSLERIGNILNNIAESLRALALVHARCSKYTQSPGEFGKRCVLLSGHDGPHRLETFLAQDGRPIPDAR